MPDRAFVIGHPIVHSRSPMLHNYWLRRYGIAGTYEPLDIAPADIDAFFARFREDGWVGGNVTVPHKTAAMKHVDRVDDAATAIGAVNTLWWEGDALVGGNTDAYGFIANLDDRAPGWSDGKARAVVLGAGGATRAVVYGLRQRGLDVALCNRTVATARTLADHFGAGVSAHELRELDALLANADLLVNATSLGMAGKPPLEIDLAPLGPQAVVCDIVYVPLETELLKSASMRGLRTVDGLGMLLHQAVDGFRRWFAQTPEVTPELRRLLEDDIRPRTSGR